MPKKKKFKADLEFKGEIIFDNLDMHHANFRETTEELVSDKRFKIFEDHFPPGFDPAKFEVKGEIVRKITIVEK